MTTTICEWCGAAWVSNSAQMHSFHGTLFIRLHQPNYHEQQSCLWGWHGQTWDSVLSYSLKNWLDYFGQFNLKLPELWDCHHLFQETVSWSSRLQCWWNASLCSCERSLSYSRLFTPSETLPYPANNSF